VALGGSVDDSEAALTSGDDSIRHFVIRGAGHQRSNISESAPVARLTIDKAVQLVEGVNAIRGVPGHGLDAKLQE
jgi:hypothetical protein